MTTRDKAYEVCVALNGGYFCEKTSTEPCESILDLLTAASGDPATAVANERARIAKRRVEE